MYIIGLKFAVLVGRRTLVSIALYISAREGCLIWIWEYYALCCIKEQKFLQNHQSACVTI